MSSIALSGNASGTGAFTIASPNSNTNRTQTLPDATGTVVLDSATQTLTNKTLTSPTINSAVFATVTGTAPIYPCRAWVNFNGVGAVSITGSGNVQSITDNGVGDYTVTFTTAMPDATYSVTSSGQGYTAIPTVPLQGPAVYTLAAGSFSVACGSNTNALGDWPVICIAVFR